MCYTIDTNQPTNNKEKSMEYIKTEWMHVVVEKKGLTMTCSVKVESPIELAKIINQHISQGYCIVAVTSTEEWSCIQQDDPTDAQMDAWAAEVLDWAAEDSMEA